MRGLEGVNGHADTPAGAGTAAGAASAVDEPRPTNRHFVGCERACGSPPAGEVLIATREGYVLRKASP